MNEQIQIRSMEGLKGLQGERSYLSGNDEIAVLASNAELARQELDQTRFALQETRLDLHETKLEADRFRCQVEHEARIKHLRTLAVGYLWLLFLGLWITGLMATNMLSPVYLAPGASMHWLYEMRQITGWLFAICLIVHFAM